MTLQSIPPSGLDGKEKHEEIENAFRWEKGRDWLITIKNPNYSPEDTRPGNTPTMTLFLGTYLEMNREATLKIVEDGQATSAA